MLGVPGLMENASAEGAAVEAQESGGTSGGSGGGGGGGGGFSEEDKAQIEEEGERAAAAGGGGAGGGAGNRWPRQETLALLKIRSDMDGVFRDSSLKGPLWEQVSRKMADLGYHRSAKKCKEKFENVYKYHKRTKEGRSTKPEGKTYRFFDQLEAFENTSSSSASAHHQLTSAAAAAPPPPPPRPPQVPAMAVSAARPMQAAVNANNPTPNAAAAANVAQNTAAASATQSFNNFINSTFPPTQTAVTQQATATTAIVPPSQQTLSSFLSNFTTSSSSTSSDEDIGRRRKRKRKWKDFFERLMKDVIDKQEELQKRFLETLEKRERDRMIREEAWRVQEMARINREHELLVQERSMAAARESALVSFLQKMTQQQNPQNPNSTVPPQLQIPIQVPEIPFPPQQQPAATPPPPPPPPPPATAAPPASALAPPPPPPTTTDINRKSDNGGENFTGSTSSSSSRWPKAEVQALIELRTRMDNKYQEAGPKGPLWEDISAGMRRLGYNRNAKRCKEKWENINKYFKKVKESNKRRPEDSKTCPYFHQLDSLYREKAKADASLHTAGYANTVPIMARPEQQWPLSHDQQLPLQQSAMEEQDRENIDQNDDDDDDEDDDDDGDDDEEDESGGYEIVTNKPTSSVAAAATTTSVG